MLSLHLAARARGPTRRIGLMAGLGLLLAGGMILSLGFGQVAIPPGDVAAILLRQLLPDRVALAAHWPASNELVVLKIRLPRVLAAALVGAGLAAAGAAYQNLFRNPLVSPDILGVSAGAGFGASLAAMLGLGMAVTQGMAFAMGLTAVGFAYLVAQLVNRQSLIVLVLLGVVTAALFQALISVVKILVDPTNTLPIITFWLMGGLNKVSAADLPVAGGLIVAAAAVLVALRWPINTLSLGEDEARQLGVDVGRVRLALILSATLMTAASVGIAGIVGWIGLIAPHAARILVGPGFARLLPAAMLIGALFLLAVDNVARGAASMEFPLGILTALIGAPLFVALLLKARVGWS